MAHVQADLSGKAKGQRGRPIPALSLPVHQEGLQILPNQMKSTPIVFLVVLVSAAVVLFQDTGSAASRELSKATLSAAARIIDSISNAFVPPEVLHIAATHHGLGTDGIPKTITPTRPTISDKKYTLLVSAHLTQESWLLRDVNTNHNRFAPGELLPYQNTPNGISQFPITLTIMP